MEEEIQISDSKRGIYLIYGHGFGSLDCPCPDAQVETWKVIREESDFERQIQEYKRRVYQPLYGEMVPLAKIGMSENFWGDEGKSSRAKAYLSHVADFRNHLWIGLPSRMESQFHTILRELRYRGIVMNKDHFMQPGEREDHFYFTEGFIRFLVKVEGIYNEGKGKKDLIKFIDTTYEICTTFSNEPGIKLSLECSGINLSNISKECLKGCIDTRKRALKYIEKFSGIMPKVKKCIEDELEMCREETDRRFFLG